MKTVQHAFLILAALAGLNTRLPAQTIHVPWADRITGVNFVDPPVMTKDNSDNVYVAGEELAGMAPGSSSFLVVKYDPDGSRVWTARNPGDGPGYKAPVRITVDGQGNVYVAGRASDDGGATFGVAAMKFDASGSLLWKTLWSSGIGSSHVTTAMSIDSGQNLYLCGEIVVSNANSRLFLLKLDGAGQPAWARTDGQPDRVSWLQALALDGSGNVYTTGGLNGSFDSGFVYLTGLVIRKFDPDGNILWTQIDPYQWLSADESWYLSGYAVVLAPDGNVVVAGLGRYFSAIGFQYYQQLYKFAPDGTLLWENDPVYTRLTAFAMDAAGNIYTGGRYDFTTLKFSPDGRKLWEHSLGLAGTQSTVRAIAVGSDGSVWAGGQFGTGQYGDGPPRQCFVRISPEGQGLAGGAYGETPGTVTGAVVDGNGNLYTTGTSGLDYLTLKLTFPGPLQ